MRKEEFQKMNERRKMFLIYTILNNYYAYLRPGVESNIEFWKNYLDQEYLEIQKTNDLKNNKLIILSQALDKGLNHLKEYLIQQSSYVIFEQMGIEDFIYINDIDIINEINSLENVIIDLEEKLENDKIRVQKILERKIR